MRVIASIIVGFILCIGCSTSKPAVDGNNDELRFGNYGGYSGAYVEKLIYSNGKTFYKRNKKGKFVAGETLQENQAKRIFANYTKFGLDTMTLQDPGSITYFVEAKVGGKKHKLVWGGKSAPLDPKLKMFYNVVKESVKKKTVDK